MTLDEICQVITDGDHQAPPKTENGIPFLVISDIITGKITFDKARFVSKGYFNSISPERKPEIGDILFTVTGSYGVPVKVDAATPFCFQRHIALIKPLISHDFLALWLSSDYVMKYCNSKATGTAQKTVGLASLRELLIPLPSQKELLSITHTLQKFFDLVKVLDLSDSNLKTAISKTKSKILDLAMQGKLVPQDPTDEPAADMLRRVNPKAEIIGDNPHYPQLPDNWVYCKFGEIADIARGGSPRPIKSYITDNPNGINWIKISDAQGKYINATKEKIISDGAKKSRLVRKGDFLLTNSMSFGHPYILNIDGCIHDGWLVISPRMKSFDKNFLYYMLTSSFISSQFSSMAGGAVVSNLNSDKVASTIVPLLSICEQQRIVAKIEELYSILDDIEKSLTN